jgi:hypothetical protein
MYLYLYEITLNVQFESSTSTLCSNDIFIPLWHIFYNFSNYSYIQLGPFNVQSISQIFNSTDWGVMSGNSILQQFPHILNGI